MYGGLACLFQFLLTIDLHPPPRPNPICPRFAFKSVVTSGKHLESCFCWFSFGSRWGSRWGVGGEEGVKGGWGDREAF